MASVDSGGRGKRYDYLVEEQRLRGIAHGLTRADVRRAPLEQCADALEDCRQRLNDALLSLASYDKPLAEHIRNKVL